jgi:hypothetical protein
MISSETILEPQKQTQPNPIDPTNQIPPLQNGTGQRQHTHFGCTTMQQCLGADVGCGSSGHDIIDQQYTLIRDAPIFPDPEGLPQIGGTLFFFQTGLRQGRLMAP